MNEDKIEHINKEVLNERRKQFSKFGDQEHSFPTWISILTEEVGEAAREANDFNFTKVEKEKEDTIIRLREEMLQTVAVGVQIIEKIDETIEEMESLK